MNQDQWQLIKALFEQASNLSAEQQQTFVIAQAKGDQIVIDKVLSMVATQTPEASDDILVQQKHSLSQLVSDSVNEVFSQPEVLNIGDVVENFTILSVLAKGAWAVCF